MSEGCWLLAVGEVDVERNVYRGDGLVYEDRWKFGRCRILELCWEDV